MTADDAAPASWPVFPIAAPSFPFCSEYQIIRGIAGNTSREYARPMPNSSEPQVIVRGKKGLAQYLQIGETMAAELLMTGTVPSIKIGRARIVPVAGIEEYLAAAQRRAACNVKRRPRRRRVGLIRTATITFHTPTSDPRSTIPIERTFKRSKQSAANFVARRSPHVSRPGVAFALTQCVGADSLRRLRWGQIPRRRWCHFDCVVRWHVAPDTLPEWMP